MSHNNVFKIRKKKKKKYIRYESDERRRPEGVTCWIDLKRRRSITHTHTYIYIYIISSLSSFKT